MNEDFVMCIVACINRIVGILIKNDHVVCYESQKLKEHERIYDIRHLELAIVMDTLKTWMHYLIRREIVLRTYHNGLIYLLDQPNLNARQAR